MRRVDDYRQNAEDCRALAGKMPPAVRDQLLKMAQHWEELGESRLRYLALRGPTDEPDPALDPSNEA